MHKFQKLSFIPKIMYGNISFKDRSHMFNYVPLKLLNDKESILNALHDVKSVKYIWAAINVKIGIDELFMKSMIKANGEMLMFAPQKLRHDKATVLDAVESFGGALVFASDQLKGDKEIVLKAVSNCGKAIWQTLSFRDDLDVALTAVKHCGLSLQAFDHKIRNDPYIAATAIRNNPAALDYISFDLKDDKSFTAPILRLNPFMSYYLIRIVTGKEFDVYNTEPLLAFAMVDSGVYFTTAKYISKYEHLATEIFEIIIPHTALIKFLYHDCAITDNYIRKSQKKNKLDTNIILNNGGYYQ